MGSIELGSINATSSAVLEYMSTIEFNVFAVALWNNGVELGHLSKNVASKHMKSVFNSMLSRTHR